jgi:misshapen/NIK-related kinase
MPDLLPQQSSGGSPVTGMTRLNSTEDAKQKPFMSFGFSAEAGGAKPVIGAGGAGDPSRRESTHVPSVNVAPTPAVHDMTSDTPEIRKYKKRFNSEILCAALWGVNLLIGNFFFSEDIKFSEFHVCDILQFFKKYGREQTST